MADIWRTAIQKGMYIKLIGIGRDAHRFAGPEELKSRKVGWECVQWFPDSAGFIANAHRVGGRIRVFGIRKRAACGEFPLLGGEPRKIRDAAVGYSVIARWRLDRHSGPIKGKFGEREIWVMGPGGEQGRKLIDAGEDQRDFPIELVGEMGKKFCSGMADATGDSAGEQRSGGRRARYDLVGYERYETSERLFVAGRWTTHCIPRRSPDSLFRKSLQFLGEWGLMRARAWRTKSRGELRIGRDFA